MSYLLLIQKLKVKGANALSSPYAITGAPIMAANLFAHALSRIVGTKSTGVAYLHHDGRYHAESDVSADFNKTTFYQPRAASFISKKDYAGDSLSLSLQPVATISLTVSLIIEFESRPNEENVKKFLYGGRFAGGVIEGYRDVLVFDEYDGSGYLALPATGYWLVDRNDLMEGNDPVASLVSNLGAQPLRDNPESPGWLTPAVTGYALISEPDSERQGVRTLSDGTVPLHAFAEPLLGLAQFSSVRSREVGDIPFWRAAWTAENVFIIKQTSA